MALNATTLADDIKNALGFSAEPTSQKNKDLAKSIVDHLKTAVVNFLPGTINGTAPPSGGPLTGGTGVGGLIVLVPGDIQTRLIATFGVSTPEILGMGTAISTHLATGLVGFAAGTITGACSNTPVSPGVLVGVGANGTISGLSGSVLATLMASLMSKPGPTPELTAMCNAIVAHVTSNAVAALSVVSGVCSAGGGPIAAGASVGGTIT